MHIQFAVLTQPGLFLSLFHFPLSLASSSHTSSAAQSLQPTLLFHVQTQPNPNNPIPCVVVTFFVCVCVCLVAVVVVPSAEVMCCCVALRYAFRSLSVCVMWPCVCCPVCASRRPCGLYSSGAVCHKSLATTLRLGVASPEIPLRSCVFPEQHDRNTGRHK